MSWRETKHERLMALRAGRQIIETEHGKIEYADQGKGVPTLVMHGIMGTYEHGTNYAKPLLEHNIRTISPSRLGYTLAPVVDKPNENTDLLERQTALMAGLLDALGLPKAGIVAISGSGPAGLAFAKNYAERCSSLTLISAITYRPTWYRMLGLRVLGTLLRRMPGLDLLTWAGTRAAVKTLPYWSFLKPKLREQIVKEADKRALYEEVVQDFFPLSIVVDGYFTDLEIYRRLHPSRPVLTDVPTLVIHSRSSAILPHNHSTAVEESATPSESLYVEDAGHAMHISHADLVWGRVADFTKKHYEGDSQS